jgi:hypothetical protein
MFKRYFLLILSLISFAKAGSLFAQQTTQIDLSDCVDDCVDTMIQVGAGGMTSTKGGFDVLLKVTSDVLLQKGFGYYVIATIDTDLATNGKQINYVNLKFTGLGVGTATDIEEKFKGNINFTILNVNYQRNILINNVGTFRVNLVGVRGGTEFNLSEKIAAVLKGSVDLLGYAINERLNESGINEGRGNGFRLEGGVRFNEKYVITISHEQNVVKSDPVKYYNGVACSTYYYSDSCYDPYYGGYYGCGGYWATTTCGPSYTTEYTQRRTVSETALNIIANFNKHFSAFGQVAYNVFKVTAEQNQVPQSSDGILQFKFGAAYRF